jgi:predicted O-methyltransferase YrrM
MHQMLPTPKFTALDGTLYDYLLEHRSPEDDEVVRELRAETARLGGHVTAIRRFNEAVLADTRVESVMLAVADGLTLARKLA